MFGKLLRYDMKEMARANLLICIIAFSIMLFNLMLVWFCLFCATHPGTVEFMDAIGVDLISALLTEGIILIAIILPVIITIISLIYFLNTSYGQAGYFTRLIPVKQTSVFHSKLLSVYLWMMIALLISFGAIAALIAINWAMNGSEYSFILSLFGLDLEDIWNSTPDATKWILSVGIGPAVLILVFSVLMFFVYAFSLAQKRPFRRMGFGGVVIWVAILYTAFQIFSVIALLFPWQIAFDGNGYFTIITSELWLGVAEGYGEAESGLSILFFIAPPVFALITYLYCKKEYSTNINMK